MRGVAVSDGFHLDAVASCRCLNPHHGHGLAASWRSAIAAAYEHNCALMSNAGMRCWGLNEQGELGEVTRLRTTPVQVLGTCE